MKNQNTGQNYFQNEIPISALLKRYKFLMLFIVAGKLFAQTAPNLGAAGDYAVLSGQAIHTDQTVRLFGNAGASGIIDEGLQPSGSFDYNGTGAVLNALTDLSSAILYCDSLPIDSAFGNDLEGVFHSGVYNITGNAYLNGGSINFLGDANSVFVINISGSLTISENAMVTFQDGVLPKNIFWNVQNGVSIDEASVFGNILSSQDINIRNTMHGSASLLSLGAINISLLPSKYPDPFLYANNFSFPTNPPSFSMPPTANCNWANHSISGTSSEGRAVAYDSQGNVYITGIIYGPGPINFGGCSSCNVSFPVGSQWQFNNFLAKYDNSGNCLWVQKISCSYNAESFDITVDANDDVYIVGSFQNVAWWGWTIRFYNTPGSAAYYTPQVSNLGFFMFLAKYNSSGTRQWVSYTGDNGGTANKNQYGCGLKAFGTGAAIQLYITGRSDNLVTFYSQSAPPVTLTSGGVNNSSAFVARYDASGNYQGGSLTESVSTSSYSNSNAVDVDASGNCYITGWIQNPIKFSGTTTLTSVSGTQDIFIAKYNNSMNFQWAKSAYTLSGTSSVDVGNDIAVRNSSAYITGSIYGNANFGGCATCLPNPGVAGLYRNIFTAKYDLAGNPLWVSTATSAGNFYLNANGIFVDPNECNVNICGKLKNSNFGTCPTCLTPATGLYIATYSVNGTCQELTPYLSSTTNSELNDIVVTSCNKTAGTGKINGNITIGTIPTISSPSMINPYVFQYFRNPVVMQKNCTTISTCSSCSSYQWYSGIIPTGAPITGATSLNYGPVSLTGNYYLTVTDVSGCTASIQVILTGNPTISVVASPTTVLCGQSSTLTASGGNTYTWSPATGLSGTTGTSVTATPITTTTYTCTGTNTLTGCSNTTTVTITVSPITITVNPAISNINCGQSVTLSASGATSYSWSPALGLNSATGATVVANPGFSTAYAVTGTMPSGCSATGSAVVNINTICCTGSPVSTGTPSTFTTSPGSYDYASNWGPAGTVIAGDYTCPGGTIVFAINGVFHVDQDIMFTKIIIKMGPYAQIKIEKGAKLTFQTVLVEACNGVMWDKIWLSEPSAKFEANSFTGCNNIIQDGITALVSDFGAQYTIQKTSFDNNYKGIVVNQFAGNHPGIVIESVFTSSSGLLPPYSTMAKGYIGIELNDVQNISIGYPSSFLVTNKFDNMYFGIHSVRSNVLIKNNKFSNFSNYSFGSYCYLQNCCLTGTCLDNLGCQCISSGVAIYDHGNPAVLVPSVGLTVGGLSSPYDLNTFTSCYAGVLSQNNSKRNINILANTFAQINKGILIRNAHNGYIKVIKNNLDNFYAGTNHQSYGISISYANQGQMDISSNLINNISPAWAHYGISVQSTNYVASPPYGSVTRSICGNRIRQSYNGIYLSTARTLLVNKNDIYFPAGTSGTRVGIKASSSPVNIEFNTLFHPGIPMASDTNKLIGIYGINSPGLYVAGHNIGIGIMGMGSGIKMQNICTNSRLILNKMTSSYNGVRLYNAKIGNQGYASGSASYEFSNDWTSNASPNFISGGISAITKWYKIGGPSSLPNNVQPSTSFLVPGTSLNYPYPPVPDCPLFNFSNNSHLGVGGGGNIPSPLSIEERETFFGEIVKGSAEYFDYSDEFSYYDKVHVYRSIIDDPSLLKLGDSDDAIYQAFKNICDNSTLGKLDQAWTLVSSEDYDGARTTLSGLIPRNLIESNLLTAYTIYLQYIPNEFFNFTTDDYATLARIANQDPAVGGEGVFLARTMLGIDPDMEEEPSLRIVQQPNEKHQSVITESSVGRIYPNPTSGDLFLDYAIVKGETASIVIYDVLGREVFRCQLSREKNNLLIPSDAIGDGLFIYKVEVNGQEKVRERIVKFSRRN